MMALGAVVGCNRFQPEVQPVVFPIEGAHAALTCEACHTEPQPFGPLPTVCTSCHEADRPSPTHFPQQTCNDAGCHSSAHFAWTDVIGDGGFHDFLPLEGSHDIDCSSCHKDLEDYADLPGVSAYCWNCHEAERWADDPDGSHYALPAGAPADQLDPRFRWDCGPCHEPVQWSTNPFEHGPRSPHGAMSSITPNGEDCVDTPPETWVTGCNGCHPTSTATFVCYACHPDSHGGSFNEATCTNDGCHVSAQPPDCDSLVTPFP